VSDATIPAAPAVKNAVRPTTVRWTHIALPSVDIDASIAWYEKHTPLRLLERREDADGYGAWLGHPDNGDRPFILVLVSFFRDQEKGEKMPIMAPFAHIGFEMPTREDVDAIAAIGNESGCTVWQPTEMPQPIGYICALTDPDGNMIEYSFDQGVYTKAKEVWG
jgi:catechol 2,3-dioxygenase-like lactoylglutathione lyase family enzyme